ncbi:MAG: cation transporter, partial [Bacteroidetes bacterium]|nr:cation transporter [Bacteroidota bacterium]
MVHHHHNHHNSSEEVSNIRMAFFLNLCFTFLEIAGGIYTNSVAIMSDALHDLGDSLSLGLAWYFQKLSSKKRDGKFSFGYRRFSLLGAIVNSIVLVIGSILILNETIPRIIEPVQADAKGKILFAVL